MAEFRAPTGEWRPIATVDIVLLTLHEGALHAAVMRRPNEPFNGQLALPGGYIRPEIDPDLDAAARRVLNDKVGLPPYHIEQMHTVSGPDRDPRGWSLSVIYLALVPHRQLPDTERQFELHSVQDLLAASDLAFDHGAILALAMKRLKGKAAYSTLPAALLEGNFTLSELQAAYEAILGSPLVRTVFRKKVLSLDVLEQIGERRIVSARSRPAEVYRLRDGISTFDKILSGRED